MFTRRGIAGTLLAFALAAIPAAAQKAKHEIDPEILNYKLSMDRIRAFDATMRKAKAAAKADPSLKREMDAEPPKDENLNQVVARLEKSPKFMALIKSGGFTAREFCVLPMALMSAGGAYMIQTQYHKDASSLATPENLAFYTKNHVEIEKLTQGWSEEH